MKRYEVYKNIRKRAVIFGLSISLFAIMMISIVASLLVIIFSFSFTVVIGAFAFNSVLYISLTRIASKPQFFNAITTFPKLISNKKTSLLDYEEN